MKISLGCIYAVIILAFAIQTSADPLTVKTPSGPIHGKLIHNEKVRAFLGIPYGAPPIGLLRWKAPEPAAPWQGTLDATNFGHHCAQNHVFDDMQFQDGTDPVGKGSEDCLSLNIYTPANALTNLPVMFWIHGGGYSGGGSSEPRHNGDFLPGKGVLLVTINYRLGVFGFLASSELAAEQPARAGNYGLQDMVAALQWVHQNIASFGGDPANVTIFGESAGSRAVSTLMALPSARGLFAKAIGESGSALLLTGALPLETLAVRGPKDSAWAAETGAKSLADLRTLTTDQILAAAAKRGVTGFAPVVDGHFLPETVAETFAAGRQAHVPLLAGFNHDEGSYFGNGMSAAKWKAFAAKTYPSRSEEFLKLYPATTDAEAVRSASDYGGDQRIAFATWKWMEYHRKTGNSPIYRYKMDLPSPPSKFHPDGSVFHSDDIEYVFGTLDTRPGAVWHDADGTLSDQMMSYWTNFAKTGNPNGLDSAGKALPNWPAYTEGDPVLHLDNPITSRPDENRARYDFWLSTERH